MIHSQGIKRLSVYSVIVQAHWGFLSDYNSTQLKCGASLAAARHFQPYLTWLGYMVTGGCTLVTYGRTHTHRAVKEVKLLVERLHCKTNMIVFDALMLIC